MALSKEEILRKRYKVIADYPGNPFEISAIIEPTGTHQYEQIECAYFDRYPHIFQPLGWWEEREEKDMPDYVKSLINQEFYKVVVKNKVSFSAVQEWKGGWGIDYPWDNVLPATQEEYDLQFAKK